MKTSWSPAFKSGMVLAAVSIAAIAASTALNGVHAQNEDDETTAAATAYAEFQYATLSGSNNAINITMLPVVLGNGSLVYKNLTVPVTVNPTSGKITLGALTESAAPIPQVSSFKAGSYAGPGGASGGMLLTLFGPGVTSGGATEWSVSTTSGATGCTYPYSGTFYVGPLSSNPLYARLKKAGITSTAYSYGVMGGQVCGAGDWWQNGAIVGFSQTGNALNIVSFTWAGTDYATAGSQITYVFD